jgi:hypothetical protein
LNDHTYSELTDHAGTVGEVILRVEEVIEVARRQHSRMGYFASLYLHVARKFKESVEEGLFRHPELIDGLDVAFMNRYLQAIRLHQSSGEASPPWETAFRAGMSDRPTVLQHLLLGMNAHINYDLGIAISEVVSKKDLPLLKADFESMNEVLFSLLHHVERDLAKVWPLLGWFQRLFGRLEDRIIEFGMKEARALAWRTAEELVALDDGRRADHIRRLGREVTRIGEALADPGMPMRAALAMVRAGEPRSVQHIIDLLDESLIRVQTTPTGVEG